MKAENKYLLKWSKIMLIILIPFLIMGILAAVVAGRTLMLFMCVGVVLVMFYTAFLENKIFGKLEKILGVKLKNDKSFSRFSYHMKDFLGVF